MKKDKAVNNCDIIPCTEDDYYVFLHKDEFAMILDSLREYREGCGKCMTMLVDGLLNRLEGIPKDAYGHGVKFRRVTWYGQEGDGDDPGSSNNDGR